MLEVEIIMGRVGVYALEPTSSDGITSLDYVRSEFNMMDPVTKPLGMKLASEV